MESKWPDWPQPERERERESSLPFGGGGVSIPKLVGAAAALAMLLAALERLWFSKRGGGVAMHHALYS